MLQIKDSFGLKGQFLPGPNQYELVLGYNQLIRSARLLGQASLDETWTLEAGSTVHNILLQLHPELEMTDGRGEEDLK